MTQSAFVPIADIFSAAINILQDKNKFCQKCCYVNSFGGACDLQSAVAFDCTGVLEYITSPYKEDNYGENLMATSETLMKRVFIFMYGQSAPFANDTPDGYEKVMAAFAFARYLWQDREPEETDLYLPVEDILEKINESEML